MANPTDRQKILRDYLMTHFVSGKFFSIEEICEHVTYPNGEKVYKYNTNPYVHDKCVALSSDVRALNYSTDEGFKIIIKNPKGGVKLCETAEEFEAWRQHELRPCDRKWKYLNSLEYRKKRNGDMSFYDDDHNTVSTDNLKTNEVFMKGENANG